jgi:hypothetical protein
MLYGELMVACDEVHTKHINTLCGQNVEFLNWNPMAPEVADELQRVQLIKLIMQFKLMKLSYRRVAHISVLLHERTPSELDIKLYFWRYVFHIISNFLTLRWCMTLWSAFPIHEKAWQEQFQTNTLAVIKNCSTISFIGICLKGLVLILINLIEFIPLYLN